MKKWAKTLRVRVAKWQKVLDDLGKKQIGLLAAGIAYFSILAFFPLVVALVAIASLYLSPENIAQTTTALAHLLPTDLASLLTTQLHNAQGHHTDSIVAATVAIALSIISVTGATGSLMAALNVMYERKERRSFLRQKLVSLGLTLALIAAMLAIIPLLFATNGLLMQLGMPAKLLHVVQYARWLVLIFLMMIGLAVLYHVGPSRAANARWEWLSRGALIATLLWIVASVVFFWYLGSLANLTRSYSLFAGVIGMMLWFNVTSYIILLGAEINRRQEK